MGWLVLLFTQAGHMTEFWQPVRGSLEERRVVYLAFIWTEAKAKEAFVFWLIRFRLFGSDSTSGVRVFLWRFIPIRNFCWFHNHCHNCSFLNCNTFQSTRDYCTKEDSLNLTAFTNPTYKWVECVSVSREAIPISLCLVNERCQNCFEADG